MPDAPTTAPRAQRTLTVLLETRAYLPAEDGTGLPSMSVLTTAQSGTVVAIDVDADGAIDVIGEVCLWRRQRHRVVNRAVTDADTFHIIILHLRNRNRTLLATHINARRHVECQLPKMQTTDHDVRLSTSTPSVTSWAATRLIYEQSGVNIGRRPLRVHDDGGDHVVHRRTATASMTSSRRQIPDGSGGILRCPNDLTTADVSSGYVSTGNASTLATIGVTRSTSGTMLRLSTLATSTATTSMTYYQPTWSDNQDRLVRNDTSQKFAKYVISDTAAGSSSVAGRGPRRRHRRRLRVQHRR